VIVVRRTATALAFALLAMCAFALAQTAPPTPNHFVTDTQNALSNDTRTTLDGELRAYERATGHQVIVWIGDTTGDTPLEDWTVQAAHQWRIGRKGKDDGAILFLFMKDHKIRIEVGYGLEGSLTDATSQQIIDNTIRPKMRAGDTDGAVRQGAEQMLLAITPGYASQLKNPPPPPSAKSPAPPVLTIAIIVASFVFPFLIFLGLLLMSIRAANRKGIGKAGHSGGSWISALGSSLSSMSSSDDSSSSDDDFDAGGGDFGGGGASGSW
jgi:uncharacterized protein